MTKLNVALTTLLLGGLLSACGTSSLMGPRGARNPRSVKNGKTRWYERSGSSGNSEEIKDSLYSESALRGGGTNMQLYPGAR